MMRLKRGVLIVNSRNWWEEGGVDVKDLLRGGLVVRGLELGWTEGERVKRVNAGGKTYEREFLKVLMMLERRS